MIDSVRNSLHHTLLSPKTNFSNPPLRPLLFATLSTDPLLSIPYVDLVAVASRAFLGEVCIGAQRDGIINRSVAARIMNLADGTHGWSGGFSQSERLLGLGCENGEIGEVGGFEVGFGVVMLADMLGGMPTGVFDGK